MNPFEQWTRRHLAADPQEPASPPPFKVDDRVVVVQDEEDGMFLSGLHGTVLSVEFTSDVEDPFGPWVVRVGIDGMKKDNVLKFSSTELVPETGPAPTPEPLAVFVKQPEDTEPPAPHGDDYEPYMGADLDAPVPYAPTRAADLESLKPWIQRAKELRHETVFADTPVYDDVTASAMAADGLAAEVSAFLAEVAGGAS